MSTKEEIRLIIELMAVGEATPRHLSVLDEWLANDPGLGAWIACQIQQSDNRIPASARQHIDSMLARAGVFESRRRPLHMFVGHWKLCIAAVVAVILVIAAAVTVVGYDSYSPRGNMVVATGPGERSTVTLPDGTRLTLNHKSCFSFHYDRDNRERTLDLRGEAAFDVVTDPRHPFVVNCNGLRVECRGTSFDVKGYDDDPHVTVVLSDGAITASTSYHSLSMKPGTRVRYDRNTRLMETAIVDPLESTDWTRGYDRFNNEQLGDILRTLSRRYGISLLVADEELSGMRLSGTMGATTLGEMLDVVSSASSLRYTVQADSVVYFHN